MLSLGRGLLVGIDQEPLLAGKAAPDIELGNVLVRVALEVVHHVADHLQRADARRRGIAVLRDLLQQLRALRNLVEGRARVVRLSLHPGRDFRILHVLHVAIGISDRRAEVGIDDLLDGRDRRLGLREDERSGGEQRGSGNAAAQGHCGRHGETPEGRFTRGKIMPAARSGGYAFRDASRRGPTGRRQARRSLFMLRAERDLPGQRISQAATETPAPGRRAR